MADVDEKRGSRAVERQGLENQPEAQAVRVAGAADVKAVQALNQNAHNGSAGGDQNESIEIVMPKNGGGYDVLASRVKVPEKQEEPAQMAETAKIEPVTVDFLRQKAQQGDIWARSFMPDVEQAYKLPVGATRDLLVDQVLKKAEVIFRPEDRVKAQPEQKNEDQSQTSTGSIIAKQAEKNPAVEPVKALYDWANKLEPGPEKEKHQQLAREQLVALEPQTKGALDALDKRRRLALEQEDCGVHELSPRLKDAMRGHVSYPEKEIEGLRRLTPADIKKLAQAMEAGGPAAEESIRQTTRELLVRTGESGRDTLLAGINLLVGLLKYDSDLICNPEQAREDASKAGEGLGLLLLAGAQMSIGISMTVEETRQRGDYSLPLRRTGEALNLWYEKQSPADQMAIVSEISAGFGVGAFWGEARKLSKPGAFMEFLQEGLSVLPRNPEAERKALEALAGVLKGRQAMKEAAAIVIVEKAGEVVKEAQEKGSGDHFMAMVRFYEFGKKTSTKAEEVAAKLGVSKQELNRMTEKELAKYGIEKIEKRYDRLFFSAYPHLKDTGVVVHHALPQKLLDRFPGLFTATEVQSLEYFRGIPRNAMKDGESVHKLITNEWETFFREVKTPNRKQVLDKLKELDARYGRYFKPPV
ncbi:MAG: hypothetical protein LCH63_15660 [Candidatus Melainabacteria bacterium]|nr:hypothetical protein [Candidatus Melainabacteria bacterium]